MKQNIIVDVCTLWLLLPMVEMERVRKEPTNTCTEGEFEQIVRARVGLGNAVVRAIAGLIYPFIWVIERR
jgi:hypothetical protein